MSDLFCLTDAQTVRLELYFPQSHDNHALMTATC